MSLLEVRGLSRSFGAFKAVAGVDLSVDEAERRAVIGPNGAGKTTLFNLVTGLLAPDGGTVEFAGSDITGLPPHRIAAAGISRAFQITSIFGRLSVERNVQIALLASSGEAWRPWGSGWGTKQRQAHDLLEEVGLVGLAEAPAATLSHGDQRSLELAIALAGEPSLLILDEPTAGMAPAETETTMELIRRIIAERGMTLLFSEHDMDVVFGTADRITVMNRGEILSEGAPEEVRRDPRVQEVYLGAA